jgi:hypothetical protein
VYSFLRVSRASSKPLWLMEMNHSRLKSTTVLLDKCICSWGCKSRGKIGDKPLFSISSVPDSTCIVSFTSSRKTAKKKLVFSPLYK